MKRTTRKHEKSPEGRKEKETPPPQSGSLDKAREQKLSHRTGADACRERKRRGRERRNTKHLATKEGRKEDRYEKRKGREKKKTGREARATKATSYTGVLMSQPTCCCCCCVLFHFCSYAERPPPTTTTTTPRPTHFL